LLTEEQNILDLDNGAQPTYFVVSMATLNTLYINVLLFPLVHNINTLETYKIV